MKLKKIGKIWGLLVVVGIISYIIIHVNRDKKQFEKYLQSDLKTTIVKIEGNWSGGRSFDYITSNGIVINLERGKSLEIGDSINKPANSNTIEVYRKNEVGQYVFVRKYN